jgi:DMSO reductase family type II enzyme heme b subunit
MNSLLLLTMIALAARPGFEDGAPVLRAASFDGALAESVAPTAAVWEGAEAYRIPLRMSPPHPRSDDIPQQSIDTLDVRASPDGETALFPDAVAVQFPTGESELLLPALAMGSQEQKVNIWRWVAGGEAAEEGVAEGFGRLQAVDGETPVRVAGSRVDGGWAVTLWRPYAVEPVVTYRGVESGTGGQAERVAMAPGARLPCAFAVWNGAYENRGGLKAVSIWYYLQLPTP